MANELLVSVEAVFTKESKRVSFGGTFYVTVAGTDYIKGTQITALSGFPAVALDKGNITALGWIFAKNNDDTATVNIYTDATATTLFTYVPPGAIISMPFGGGVTAPAIRSSHVSETAELEYLLIEA